MQASEIVICNSLYGAWQVRELNNQRWLFSDLAERLRQKIQG
jgi:4-amino-4-deoxychorismate lyase